MKLGKRIIIGAGCFVLLLVSWLIVVNTKSDAEKQKALMEQAAALMNDGIFIRAVPLLEEAAGFSTENTAEVEDELKKAYLALIDTVGFRRKYTTLLETQMNRTGTHPDIFAEAANYYLSILKTTQALAILRTGIEMTGDEHLISLYEQNRYVYEQNRAVYDNVTAINGSTIQVQNEGLWGLAGSDGNLIIPCQYDKISTFSSDRAIVKKGNEIYAVNPDNNRLAILREAASDFGNFANDRIALLIDNAWWRATGEFIIGTASFDQLGMYSEGYIPAKIDGKWGVIDLSNNWLIPAEYDGIVQDELGRCYAQGAVFAWSSGMVYLFIGGHQIGDAYEDARPFSSEGYAAVKKGGKWGFIDPAGTLMINYCFDDALSFGQHLAAVKQEELWGYISISGKIVIEPLFAEAKSFSNGSAPVLTERGWQFITLLEYKKGATL